MENRAANLIYIVTTGFFFHVINNTGTPLNVVLMSKINPICPRYSGSHYTEAEASWDYTSVYAWFCGAQGSVLLTYFVVEEASNKTLVCSNGYHPTAAHQNIDVLIGKAKLVENGHGLSCYPVTYTGV